VNARNLRRYRLTVSRGLCFDCSKPLEGWKRLCRDCLHRGNDWRKAARKRTIDTGRCVDCKAPRGETGTGTRCRPCANAWAAHVRKRRYASKEGPSVAFVGDLRPRSHPDSRSASRSEIRRSVKCVYRGRGGRCTKKVHADWPYCFEHGACKEKGCMEPKWVAHATYCLGHSKERSKLRREQWNKTHQEVYRKETVNHSPPEFDYHSSAIALLAGRDPFR
jgi:hypothetical protein